MSKSAERPPGVLVTRPAKQSAELVAAIRSAGGVTFELPVIEILPRECAEYEIEALNQAKPDIAIFVSRNAVACLPDTLDLSTSQIAAIGPATRIALVDAGFSVDVLPEGRFDSEHLLEHPALQDVAGKRILIVRGNHGREMLANVLTARGAEVSYLSVYERVTAEPDSSALRELLQHWSDGDIDKVVVMSVNSLTSLLEIVPASHVSLLQASLLVTPSERVIQTVGDLLPGTRAILADAPNAAAMVACLFANHDE